MLPILWLILLANAVSPSSSQDMNVFLLAGQSNMSGHGGTTNGTWHLGRRRPTQMCPQPVDPQLGPKPHVGSRGRPLHRDINVNITFGVGPGMSFANSVLAKDPSIGMVRLVPCALGGSNISSWGQGSFLYDRLVSRARDAVQGGGKIQAMLWYQGERDTELQDEAELYMGQLVKFLLRCDLESPSLLIIQVALASAQGPFLEQVRRAQLGLDLENVKCVDAQGLELEPDNLHLTTRAEVQLGMMLADSFLQTRSSPP